LEVEILDTSVQRILLSWTGIIICNGIKDIANQVLWSCALCREKKKKKTLLLHGISFALCPNAKHPSLHFCLCKMGVQAHQIIWALEFCLLVYISQLIFRQTFSRTVCIGFLDYFFFFSIDRTTLVNREPIDLWALATSWVKMYFYWFKRILSFKKSKKGNLGNRPDYNNRNDNDS
jgi:hypothetical protein